MLPASRLRRHARFELDTRVRLSWVTADGLTPSLVCRAVDISEMGMRLISREPIVVRQYVSFQVESLQLSGTASVRSCIRKGMSYLVGLEFSGGTKWIPPEDRTAQDSTAQDEA